MTPFQSRKGPAIIYATLLFLFFASVWIFGTKMAAPVPTQITIPDDLGAISIEFKSDSGSNIHGSWIAHGTDSPTVILLHGVYANRMALITRAQFFKSQGYNVLFFDFQAHGESPGDRITFGKLESQDASAAVQFAKTKTPKSPIGIVGMSLGGASALIAKPTLPVQAMVLEAVYPDIQTAIDNRISHRVSFLSKALTPIFMLQMKFRLGISTEDLSPIDRIHELHIPVLLISGRQDMHTTAFDTERLFAAANEPKRMELFDNAAHEDLLAVDTKKYEAIVGKFLETHLKSATQ